MSWLLANQEHARSSERLLGCGPRDRRDNSGGHLVEDWVIRLSIVVL